METVAPAAASSEAEWRRHPLPWLNAVVTEPFYLLHLLTFFSYFAARGAADLPPQLSLHLLHREIQAILTFSVLLAVKIVKDGTWEAFISDAVLYAKGFLLAASLMIGYRLAFCYLLCFLVIFVVTQQPPYEGLGDSSHLTPLQLDNLLTEGSTPRFCLVEFRTSCLSACIRSSRLSPDLSTIYSNKNVSFGIVDLGHFPNAAEQFGISLWGQLPTYILFDKSIEVARFPEITSESKEFMPTISKKLLCQHFELDKLLLDYLSN